MLIFYKEKMVLLAAPGISATLVKKIKLHNKKTALIILGQFIYKLI